MAQYLLIGGNGIIGHFVARRLVAQGARPVIFSRGGDTTLVRDIADQCDHVRGDMTDRAAIDAALQKHRITHVVHLGAALPALTEKDPAAAVQLNIEGTAHVLQAAVDNGVARVVLASSKAVYGRMQGAYAAPTYAPVPETLHPEPDTVYGISKGACEQLAGWYRRQYGLDCVALRFAATIGPGKIARHGGSFSRYSVIVENAMAARSVSTVTSTRFAMDCSTTRARAASFARCRRRRCAIWSTTLPLDRVSACASLPPPCSGVFRMPSSRSRCCRVPAARRTSCLTLRVRAKILVSWPMPTWIGSCKPTWRRWTYLALPRMWSGGGREVARQGLMSARVDGGKGSVHVDT